MSILKAKSIANDNKFIKCKLEEICDKETFMKKIKRLKTNSKNENNSPSSFFIKDNDLSQLIEPMMVDIVKKYAKVDLGGRKPISSKKDLYIFELVEHIIEVEVKIRDLYLSELFIGNYSASNKIQKEFTRHDYIIYHLEFYYINVIALYDRVLHLINYIFNLGLADRFVTKDIITNNKNVKREVVAALNNIDKSLQGIRRLQNKIKHKIKLQERNERLKNAELFEMAAKITPNRDVQLMKLSAKIGYKLYIKLKKKELEQNRLNLIAMLNQLYNLLAPVVKKHIKQFDSFN